MQDAMTQYGRPVGRDTFLGLVPFELQEDRERIANSMFYANTLGMPPDTAYDLEPNLNANLFGTEVSALAGKQIQVQFDKTKTWRDTIIDARRRMGVEMVKTLAGQGKMFAEFLEKERLESGKTVPTMRKYFPSVSKWAKENNDRLLEWSDMMLAGVEEYYKEHQDEMFETAPGLGYGETLKFYITHPKSLVQGVLESMPLMLEGILGSMIAGPAGAIAAMGLPISGEVYADARKEGTDVIPAMGQALLTGLGEAVIEEWTLGRKLGIAKNIRRIISKGIPKVLWEGTKTFFRGTAEEGSQEFNRNFWQWVFTDRSQVWSENVRSAMGAGGIMELAMAGVFSGFGYAVQKTGPMVSKGEQLARLDKIEAAIREIPDEQVRGEILAEIAQARADVLADVYPEKGAEAPEKPPVVAQEAGEPGEVTEKPRAGIVAGAPGTDKLSRLLERARELTRATRFLTREEQAELERTDEQIEAMLVDREGELFTNIIAAAPEMRHSVVAVTGNLREIIANRHKNNPEVVEFIKEIDATGQKGDRVLLGESEYFRWAVRELTRKLRIEGRVEIIPREQVRSELLARTYIQALYVLSMPSAPVRVKYALEYAKKRGEHPGAVFMFAAKGPSQDVIAKMVQEERMQGLHKPRSLRPGSYSERGQERWKATTITALEGLSDAQLSRLASIQGTLPAYYEKPDTPPHSTYAGAYIRRRLTGQHRSATMFPVLEERALQILADRNTSPLSEAGRLEFIELFNQGIDKRLDAFKYAAERMLAKEEGAINSAWEEARQWAHEAAGEKSQLKSWPEWSEEKEAVRGYKEERVVEVIGDVPQAHQKLIKQIAKSKFAQDNVSIEYDDQEVMAHEEQARQSIGDVKYEANRARGSTHFVAGSTYFDRNRGRVRITIYRLGQRSARILAEELHHVSFNVIRAGMRGAFREIERWYQKGLKEGSDPSVDLEEAFAKKMSEETVRPGKTDLPAVVIDLANGIWSGQVTVPKKVTALLPALMTGERYAAEEEGGLILPEDIHRGEEGFQPTAKKTRGFTEAELKLFGKEFAPLVRWAQLHDEPIGYKQGVADTVEGSRRAIDALRVREQVRQRNRIDAVNLIFTYIPKEYRGSFIRRAMAVKTAKDVRSLTDAIEQWVDEYEQRELIKEFKKFKGKVQKEMRRGETPFGQLPLHLAKQIDELLNQFDPVALSERKESALQSRQEWYSRMTSLLADGYDAITAEYDKDARSFFVIPQSDIQELRRLSQTPIRDVTPDEVRWTLDLANNLLSMHQKKGESRWRRRWEALHPRINTAWHQVHKETPKPQLSGALGLFKRAATIGQSNLRTLIGYATGKDSDAVTELIFDALVEANNKRVAKYKEFVQAWQKEIDKAGIKWADVKDTLGELVKVKVGGQEIELTRDDLLMLYGYTVADGTMRRLLKTQGLNITTYRPKGLFMTAQTYRVGTPTLEELRAISELILPVHKKLLDIHFKVNREVQAPAINETSMEIQNTEIARDERYLSVHREVSRPFSGFKVEEMVAAAEMRGRYKPRTGGTLRMNIRSFTREVMTGLQSDAFYHAMTIPMMEGRSLLMNKNFTEAMKSNGHGQILDYLGTLYDRMQLYGNDQALLDQAFTTFFSQVGKSMLSLRITGGAIQVASVPAAFGVIPREYFSMKVPSRKDVKALMEKYPSLWLRWKAKQFDFALGTLTAQHAFQSMVFDKMPATDKLLNQYTWGDQIAIYNIYKAAEKMIQDTTKFEVGSEEYEKALQKLFDRAMETQPMWDALHRSIVTSDTAFFARGFTWFMSARNAQLNVLQQAFDDANKGRITETERNKRLADIAIANFCVSFLRNIIRTGIQAAGIIFLTALGLREPPDEEEVKEILKRLAIKLPMETVFNLVGLNAVTQVTTAIAYNGIRAANYKWSGYDARYLRTGNLAVDLFNDMVVMGMEGWEFGTDLITLKKFKGTKYKEGEYAFVDSGERFMRSVLLMTAYRLGLPFEGPMSDLYYPLKRAYKGK
jgi:hypothetical protein